jgi:glutamine amidotransferase-like uncharacterized protein
VTAALASILLCACRPAAGEAPAPDILLYDGAGASLNDVAALAALLRDHGFRFARAGSAAMAAMPAPALRRYRLIIVPGGDFVAMADGMSAPTVEKLRGAVGSGVGYLGICAGGFLAGRFQGKGLDLTGVKFGFYAAESRGIRKAAVPIATAGGPTLDQYWEDGPQFSGWGAAIARYPDGSPAAVEGRFGKGRVILIGVHAEAPESWRGGMRFRTTARADNDYAAQLVRAALGGQALAHW